MQEQPQEQPKAEDKPRRQPVRPTRHLFKAEALKRLKKLEGRGVTVGTQLDELRALMALILENMRG